MTFLNPIGLVGLLSLPVIVALHLLRERQRRFLVSDLRLWSFMETEVRGPRTRRIPITPLLLVDLLVAALISLAWAQPQIELGSLARAASHRVILLDVSSSMRARDGAVTRFERAQAAALSLLEDSTPGDVVTLVPFGLQARVAADSRRDGTQGLFRAVEQLDPGETGSDLRSALALGQAALVPDLPAEFHIWTDAGFPLTDELDGFAYPLTWHLIGQPADNQAVIDLNAVRQPDGRSQVFVRIANYGSRSAVRRAVLEVDGLVLDRVSLDLPADTSVVRVWQVPSDAREVSLSLQGTDSLPADDTAALGLHSGGAVKVALVADDPAALQQAVQAVPGAELRVIPPGDYDPDQAAFDLTIFRGFLPAAWPAGQVLVVDPPVQDPGVSIPPGAEGFSPAGTREVPAGAVVRAANPGPAGAGIDFSGVRWSSAWTLPDPPAGLVPLLAADDVPLLLGGNLAPATPGLVLLADLSRGNFTRHPAFPILIANLVELSSQAPLPPGFQTGEILPLPVTGSYQSIQLLPPGGDPLDLGSAWPEAWTDTLVPGLYRFRLTGAAGEVREVSAGARAGAEGESDLRPRSWATSLQTGAEQSLPDSEPERREVDLRPWLLALTVLALLWEARLAWRK